MRYIDSALLLREILYPAMEDFRLDIIIGSGAASNSANRFAKIYPYWGDNQAWVLSNPLRDRFGMHFDQFYNDLELSKIVFLLHQPSLKKEAKKRQVLR